jgi:AraC-like DNA-binding protein
MAGVGADGVYSAAVWDIATPARPRRLPGVTMAGFRSRAEGSFDLRVVPYPAVTLAIDIGEGMSVIDETTGRRERDGVVVGLAPGGVLARCVDAECVQLRLSPVLAHAVLGATAELTGAVVALTDLWGRDACRLQERLRATASWEERFALVEAALLARRADGRPVDPEVGFAWAELARRRGRVRVEELAAETGWSRQRLWSRFRAQVGLTPKRAAQLIRFDHAAHRLAAGHSAADVAAESGYADQSHLHRDVRSFAGATPTAVAAAPWLAVDDVAWADRYEPAGPRLAAMPAMSQSSPSRK